MKKLLFLSIFAFSLLSGAVEQQRFVPKKSIEEIRSMFTCQGTSCVYTRRTSSVKQIRQDVFDSFGWSEFLSYELPLAEVGLGTRLELRTSKTLKVWMGGSDCHIDPILGQLIRDSKLGEDCLDLMMKTIVFWDSPELKIDEEMFIVKIEAHEFDKQRSREYGFSLSGILDGVIDGIVPSAIFGGGSGRINFGNLTTNQLSLGFHYGSLNRTIEEYFSQASFSVSTGASIGSDSTTIFTKVLCDLIVSGCVKDQEMGMRVSGSISVRGDDADRDILIENFNLYYGKPTPVEGQIIEKISFPWRTAFSVEIGKPTAIFEKLIKRKVDKSKGEFLGKDKLSNWREKVIVVYITVSKRAESQEAVSSLYSEEEINMLPQGDDNSLKEVFESIVIRPIEDHGAGDLFKGIRFKFAPQTMTQNTVEMPLSVSYIRNGKTLNEKKIELGNFSKINLEYPNILFKDLKRDEIPRLQLAIELDDRLVEYSGVPRVLYDISYDPTLNKVYKVETSFPKKKKGGWFNGGGRGRGDGAEEDNF